MRLMGLDFELTGISSYEIDLTLGEGAGNLQARYPVSCTFFSNRNKIPGPVLLTICKSYGTTTAKSKNTNCKSYDTEQECFQNLLA